MVTTIPTALTNRNAGRSRNRPRLLSLLAAIPAVVSAGYWAIALVAAVRRAGKWKADPSARFPPVSVLKPVRGLDEHFVSAIRSHADLDYPEFEILFGVSSPDDPAKPLAEKIGPVFVAPNDAPNRKVGVLERLAGEARHRIFVVNDGDIIVPRDYLRKIVALLADSKVGLVTCLYRARGYSTATRFEALGIATEFAPSVLVARATGVKEFAMGSTLAFRAEDLARIGGFRAIREYLADDYQLGARMVKLGKRVELAEPIVETSLGTGNWLHVWRHQLRWARTIRVSNRAGFVGYGITHSIFWCLLAALAGTPGIALGAYAVRMASGLFIAHVILQDRASSKRAWLVPARDLFGFAVWCCALFGSEVEWAGASLVISSDGRILRSQ